MNNPDRTAKLPFAVIFLLVFLYANVVSAQEGPPGEVPVDVMQIVELPLGITSPILTKTEKGYLLQCTISNSSNDRIRGLTYTLLIVDPATKVQLIVSRRVAFKLAGYSIKDLTFETPRNLKVRNGDRVLFAVEQLVTRESVWEVLNSREILQAYGRGDSSVIPEVRRMLNQVDSRPQPITIF